MKYLTGTSKLVYSASFQSLYKPHPLSFVFNSLLDQYQINSQVQSFSITLIARSQTLHA